MAIFSHQMVKRKLLQIVLWVQRFIRRHFNSDNENLPYYLTILISAILFIVALNGFVELTDELGDNELKPMDERVTSHVMSYRTGWLTGYFLFATDLGDRNAYIALIVLLAVFYRIRRISWKFILQTTLVLLLASFSNIVLKQVISRERPALEHLVTVNTMSYPSGHSMSAMAFYGFLIFLCLRYKMERWLRYSLVTVLVILIVSIGLSRVYLGVHYPSDVAAGFIGGLIWIAFCAVVFSLISLLRKKKGGGEPREREKTGVARN